MLSYAFSFFIRLFKSVRDNELISVANEMTYKLLLAIFPFMIFLIALLGFLNIEYDLILESIIMDMPEEISSVINTFFNEVIYKRNLSILSSGLVIAIFSSSSGFYAVMRGLNKAYGRKECRNMIITRLISVVLVLMFAVMIVFSLLLFIFGDAIYKALINNDLLVYIPPFVYSFTGYMIMISVLVVSLMIIYKLSVCVKISFFDVFPGAVFSVVFWIISSKLFNIYVNNFSRYSKVYGSIGSVFILIFWINIISFVLLIGGQINANLLFDTKNTENSEHVTVL